MKKLKKLCLTQLNEEELGRIKGGKTTNVESFDANGKHIDSSIDDSDDPQYA